MPEKLFTVKGWNNSQESYDQFAMCYVDLICKTEEEAIKRAGKVIKRDNYRVTSVTENFDRKKKSS